MANDNTPNDALPAGGSAFLDRIQNSLSGDASPDPTPTAAPEGALDPTPSPSNEPDLSDLKGGGDAPNEPVTTLDDLSKEAFKGSPEPDKGDKPTPEVSDDTDPLSSYSPEEKAQIQAYLDDAIANELQLSESGGGAFKRLRGENRDLQQKVRELEGRTAEPEALSAANDRITELEAQLKANEESSSVLRLEETTAYRDTVIKPQQDILQRSDTIADRYGVDRDKLSDILGEPDGRRLSEAITNLLGEDVADSDKFELYNLSRQAEETFRKRDELVQNADSALKEAEELASKEKERLALDEVRGRESAATTTLDRIKEKAPFILDIVGDLKETFVKTHSQADLNTLAPEDQAFARFAFDSFIPLAHKILKLEKELQTAHDDNIKLRGATPGGPASGGVSTNSDAKPTPQEDAKSEGVKSTVSRIQASIDAALKGGSA